MTFLNGKLTYLMAGVAILYGIYSLIVGLGTQQQDFEIIWMGLTAFGVRRAIANQ